MSIVPVGKRRTMFAQNYMTPETSGLGISSEDVSLPEDPSVNGMQPEVPVDEPVDPLVEENDMTEDNGKPSLTKSIFNFLVEKAGYPPRRLHEFKSQFYDETGSKGGGTQVTITLPDLVYGSDDQIPNDSLKELINMVESQFGLSYIDYKRSNLKIILNFSSVDPQQKQLQDEQPGDLLDQVYGAPGKKKAQSMTDLIKEGKKNMLNILRGDS